MKKELRYCRPQERIVINGHVCQIERQARRSTFVRIVEGELAGSLVQLSKRSARGGWREVDAS